MLFRSNNPVLVYGDYEIIQKEHPTIYAYTRTLENVKILVLLNFSDKNSTIAMSEISNFKNIIINNYKEFSIEDDKAILMPYQAVIIEMK